jgi:hypothetical protein
MSGKVILILFSTARGSSRGAVEKPNRRLTAREREQLLLRFKSSFTHMFYHARHGIHIIDCD